MSRKLATVIAQIVGILGVVLGSAIIGEVDTDIQLAAIGLIGAGGSLNILRQAAIDKVQVSKEIEVEGIAEKVLAEAKKLEAMVIDG